MAVTDEAILKIKDMIVGGELRPGDRLPKESELAATLGLARNSLREAVRALSVMNILDVRQGDGTYVTSLDSARLLEALTFVVDFHRDDSVMQFFEVRRIMEPAAAALAATRITDEQLAKLSGIMAEIDASSTLEQLVASDLEFHRYIGEASANTVLGSIVDAMSAPTHRARIWRALTEHGARERTLHEHRAIYDALAAHEPDVARSWMTVHISGVEEWLRQVLGG